MKTCWRPDRYGGTWSVTAFAVCADAYPFLLAGAYLAQAQDETGYAGSSFPVAVAICAG